MSAIVDTHADAAELELAPLLMREPLAAFLDAHVRRRRRAARGRAGRRGPLERHVPDPPRRAASGAAPPAPPAAAAVAPTTCCARRGCCSAVEHADVRTPRVLATCDDESVIGAPFYVMEKVEGDVITTQVPAALDTPEQRAPRSPTS